MRDILELAKVDNTIQADLLLTAQELSKRKPAKMTKHVDLLFDDRGWETIFLPWIHDIVGTLAVFDKVRRRSTGVFSDKPDQLKGFLNV